MTVRGAERQVEGMDRFLQLAEEGANWQLRVAVGWKGTRYQRVGDEDCSILLSNIALISRDRRFLEEEREQILSSDEQVVGLPSGLALDLTSEQQPFFRRVFGKLQDPEPLRGIAPWEMLTPRGII